MLSLFPTEYWLLLAAIASGRFISGQLLSRRLSQLKRENHSLLVETVTSKKFTYFLRFNGLAHLVLVAGLLTIYYITYEYIVPINLDSLYMLHIVRIVGYTILTIEIIVSALAMLVTVLILKKR